VDSWLQRLVVRGTVADVAAFKKAAASASKPYYLYQRAQLRTQRLSFVRLRASLPQTLAREIDDPQEPWDLVIDHPIVSKMELSNLPTDFSSTPLNAKP
jgi:hypothetical protein